MPSSPIETAAAESELVRAALEMAREAHAGQTRNGSGGMSYINHPVAVAELLAEHGFEEETIAAALLHDVVEDSEASAEDIEDRFGERVGNLVGAMTDAETIEPYERRKAEHRRRVQRAGGDALAIYVADKLSNVRTLRRAYAEQGESVGEEFQPSLDVKEGVWKDDLEMLRRSAPDLPYLADLEAELVALHEARAGGAVS